jgi:hypothetical protein
MKEENKKEIKKRLDESEAIEDNKKYLEEREQLDKLRKSLGENYENIKEALKEYCDLKEEYYDLVAIWIIGTYLYQNFETYPYLFINASKGSGKTRLLKIIAELSNQGEIITSLREAVLFRTAQNRTMCIDEFEGLGKKENAPLRELLNAGYKKGLKVKRMKKVRTQEGDEQVVEEFELYTPICMANIYGMEEVLGDRCVTLILDKSDDPRIMKLVENFSDSAIFSKIRGVFSVVSVETTQCSFFKNVTKQWNNYINEMHNYTPTYTTYTTLTTLTTPYSTNFKLHLNAIFNRIYNTGIDGRNLELLFPLLLLADFINEEIFNKMLKIAKETTEEKRREEIIESKDVSLIDFVSQMGLDRDFKSIKIITREFRDFLSIDEGDEKWINSRWFGRALKRLSLVKEKRRVRQGIEIIADVDKATKKMRVLKEPKEEDVTI